MIRPKLSAAAEGVSIDQQTSELTLYNVLEAIEAEGFPVFIQRMNFMALLLRDVNADPNTIEGNLRVSLGEHVIHERAVPIDFQGRGRNRLVFRFGGLLIPSPGQLRFRLTIPEHETTDYTIDVAQRPAGAAQGAPAAGQQP